MNKTALITGATSGIGKAIAKKFAENGYNIIITGRRQQRLTELKDNLSTNNQIKVLDLCFDVRDKDSVFSTLEKLPASWDQIDVLINNAGLAVGTNKIHEGEIDDWERMIDTNVKGLLYVSRAILPKMAAQQQGHIINIGSIAGKQVYPNGNVYCASKHAVDALTQAMRIDALDHNIKVTQVSPGAVETEFSIVRYKGDKDKADKVYQGFTPLSGEDVADVTFYAASLPPHVNINDLVVIPTAQANATTFNKSL
ncbi:MAG: SDR family NAD(P)-dependent oxidoreductase [Bacteroidales bacterium]|nr:SDR family NAD(P)-dependent oxidoreductase [Bacteroidales bacterium]MCF8328262.1 SDR family NAD(P)-dependent oxidoreductase [Bacteroidales bacterium]